MKISTLIKNCYLLLFFLTPLIFTSFNSELFELPKMFLVYFLTAVILTLHLLNFFSHKIPLFRRSFLDIPLILFLLSQIISTFISVDPHTSIFGYYSRLNGGLLSLLSYLILYWILVVYIDEKFKNSLINTSLNSGLIIAIFGIAEHFGIDKNLWVQDVQNRVFSTLGQPNWLAAYLCILLPFSLSTIYDPRSTIFFVCLLFTKSKSGIIAAIISLSIYFIFTFIKKPPFFKGGRPAVAGQVGLIIILIILSLTINNPIKDLVFPIKQTSTTYDQPSTILITPSGDIRKIVWKGSVDLWKKFPIFGTGVETFAYSYYWTRPVEHNLTSEWDFLYNKAHNEYLNYLATTGTFGLITYLILIFTILLRSTIYDLRSMILCSFLSILITNLAGFSVVTTSLYFFLLPAFLIKNRPVKGDPPLAERVFPLFFSLVTILLFFFLSQKILHFYIADITYSQANNLENQQNYEKAYQYIKTSLRYNPTEPLYLIKLSSIASKLAFTTKESKYINEAIKTSTEAINISPANTNFWKEKAQIYYYLSNIDTKYFKEAITSLLKVTSLAPTDAKAFYLLGKFLETADLTQDAIDYYQQAINLKPNYDHAYFALGQIYFNQKKYPEAKKNFESVLQIAPTSTDAQNYLKKINQFD